MKANLTDITANNLNQAVAAVSNLPTVLGNMAKNHFLEGFQNGGGQTDRSRGGWPARTTKNKSDRRSSKSRALLVDSGDLRRSIRSIVRTGGFSVLTDDTAYAERHNDGLSGMPQREFIGESKELDNKIEKEIKETLDHIFK